MTQIMKEIIAFALFVIFPGSLIAQSDWTWQNPLPQGNTFVDVHAIDENMVIAVGSAGTVLRTVDGGESWEVQNIDEPEWLVSVHFVDENNGWIVGYSGTIIHTSDCGNSWTYQKSGTDFDLRSVFFVDSKTGWAVGYDAVFTIWGDAESEKIILHTRDGRNTWSKQYKGSDYILSSIYFYDENNGWGV